MDPQARFDERIRTLKVGYVAGLPERLAAMRRAARAGDRASVQLEAHRLAGTGLLYDLPQLSAWGRAVEQKLKSGAPLGDLDADLDALSDLIAAVVPWSAVG